KGTVLVEELEKLAKETEFQAGYVRVKTPHLAKEKMYKTSGHLPYYAESMFPSMELPLEPEQKARAERDLAIAQANYEKVERQAKATDEFKAESEKPVRI